MVPLPGNRKTMETRNNKCSSLSPDQIAAQLAVIAAKLDAIHSQLRGDVAELKTLMLGMPLRCNNQDLAKKEIVNTKPKDDEDRLKHDTKGISRNYCNDDEDLFEHVVSSQLKIEDGVLWKTEDREKTQNHSKRLRTNLQINRERMNTQVGFIWRKLNFEVWDMVSPRIQSHLYFRKIPPRSRCPYLIIPMLSTYQFEAPPHSRVYPVSHVSLPKTAGVQVTATPLTLLPITKNSDIDFQPQPTIEWLIAWHNCQLSNSAALHHLTIEPFKEQLHGGTAWFQSTRLEDKSSFPGGK